MQVFVKLTMGVFFTLIVLVNLCHSLKHLLPRNTGKGPSIERTLLKQMESFLQQPFPLAVSKLMGTESPFGFFAPEVGNQYILTFQLYNRDGKLLGTLGTPNLHLQESLHRYANFSTQFSKLQKKECTTRADSMQTRYLQAIANSLAVHFATPDPLVSKVHLRVMLYSYPGLHKSLSKAPDYSTPRYYLLYQKTIDVSNTTFRSRSAHGNGTYLFN
jgi:hypothetical protein